MCSPHGVYLLFCVHRTAQVTASDTVARPPPPWQEPAHPGFLGASHPRPGRWPSLSLFHCLVGGLEQKGPTYLLDNTMGLDETRKPGPP